MLLIHTKDDGLVYFDLTKCINIFGEGQPNFNNSDIMINKITLNNFTAKTKVKLICSKCSEEPSLEHIKVACRNCKEIFSIENARVATKSGGVFCEKCIERYSKDETVVGLSSILNSKGYMRV
ncbi:MAG: hypothetical protein BV457_08460 [Thermoplasmata archaeon M9B1D]|nr:MAG: hypothetical protein BV457_08460 [Thermoplasmata archaeon M9B1D]PNX46315.1 MAG: hypothetical protein BV456_12425 [Thermoplasmata archaeon M8B2D]